MRITLINIVAFSLLGTTSLLAQNKGDIRISLDGGFGFRTAATAEGWPPEYEDHINGLKSGFNFNAQASYFFGEEWGLGLVYDVMRSKNETVFSEPIDFGFGPVSNTGDIIRVSLIAPEFLYRAVASNEKHSFLITSAIGYLAYVNEGVIGGFALDLTGGSVGFKVGFGYDYHITPSIALGASANLITGSLSKYTVEGAEFSQEVELEDDERENLSRFTINAGIRFFL